MSVLAVLYGVFAAARHKAEADLGDGNDGGALLIHDRRAYHRVYVHHAADALHGGLHHIVDGMLLLHRCSSLKMSVGMGQTAAAGRSPDAYCLRLRR